MICFLLVGIRSCTARSRSTPATAGWLLLCSNLPCGGDYISDVPEKRPSLPWTGGPVLPSCAQFQFDAIRLFPSIVGTMALFCFTKKNWWHCDLAIWEFCTSSSPPTPREKKTGRNYHYSSEKESFFYNNEKESIGSCLYSQKAPFLNVVIFYPTFCFLLHYMIPKQ